jgi:hypothetical protein
LTGDVRRAAKAKWLEEAERRGVQDAEGAPREVGAGLTVGAEALQLMHRQAALLR